jgi:hypothetical protein
VAAGSCSKSDTPTIAAATAPPIAVFCLVVMLVADKECVNEQAYYDCSTNCIYHVISHCLSTFLLREGVLRRVGMVSRKQNKRI